MKINDPHTWQQWLLKKVLALCSVRICLNDSVSGRAESFQVTAVHFDGPDYAVFVAYAPGLLTPQKSELNLPRSIQLPPELEREAEKRRRADRGYSRASMPVQPVAQAPARRRDEEERSRRDEPPAYDFIGSLAATSYSEPSPSPSPSVSDSYSAPSSDSGGSDFGGGSSGGGGASDSW